MRRIVMLAALGAPLLFLTDAEGRGFRGAVGGRAAIGPAGGYRSAAAIGPYGAGVSRQVYSRPVVGPGGGVQRYGATSGAAVTPRGSTVRYGGVGSTTRGPFGGVSGRGAGGVQVITPSGQTYTRAGTAGGAVGPGGRAVGGRSGFATTAGPRGYGMSSYRGGVAIGPHGAVGGSTRAGAVAGPGGVAVGGARTGIAAGPYGAAAVGSRGVVTTRPGGTAVATSRRYGTYYASSTTLRTQATYVRRGFTGYSYFTPTWYRRYPGVWYPPRWTAATAWVAAPWPTVAAWCAIPATPIYYDYGSSVVYVDNSVYVNGVPTATAETYAQQAAAIADTGRQATPPEGDDWQSLGVFAMVQGEEETSYNIFQLAVNKQGILRGTYYNALTDTTQPVYGSVDRNTQRAAWTVGDKKTPVFETGIANLTRDETTLLVHFDDSKVEQLSLVRIQKPEEN